jgi:NADH-quinone oxidoreductase subunit N
MKFLNLGYFLFFFSLFLKIGGFPYSQNIIRIYKELDIRILFKILLFPLIIYIIFFYKIFNLINILYFSNKIFFIFFILSIVSIFFGSLAGLFKNQIGSILTYSSILNFGFIFLAIIIHFTSNLTKSNIMEFLFIYIINNLLLFLLLIYYPTYNKVFINILSLNNKLRTEKNNTNSIATEEIFKFKNLNLNLVASPLARLVGYFILLNIIFSFIGIPPFAGFYIKLNLLLNSFSNLSNFSLLISLLIILGTLLSTFFYLKFFFEFFFKDSLNSLFTFFNFNPSLYSYLISLLSLFLINYSFLIYFLFPYFQDF